MALGFVLAAGVVAAATAQPVVPPPNNVFPTIGIVSLPLEGEPHCVTSGRKMFPHLRDREGQLGWNATESCFNSYYVNWIYSAGARVAVIPFDAPFDVLDTILDSVNGVLLTGGGLEADVLNLTSTYMAAAAYIVNKAKAKTDAGVFFPVHGTCQGFQVLCILAAGDPSVLQEGAYDSEDLPLPLDFNWTQAYASRAWGRDAPADVLLTLSTQPVTINFHRDGVHPDQWLNHSGLASMYRPVSSNVDRTGLPFVSTIEAYNYPITGTQWHPERNQFEWSAPSVGINHGLPGITAVQYLANHIVQDARRNSQTFTNVTLENLLSMYNYPLVNVGEDPLQGDLAYYFNL